jgi:NAD+ kinase
METLLVSTSPAGRVSEVGGPLKLSTAGISEARDTTAVGDVQQDNLKCSIGSDLLRGCLHHIDPLEFKSGQDEVDEPQSGLSTASTKFEDWPLEDSSSSPSGNSLPFRLPKSFSNHRSGTMSIDPSAQQSLVVNTVNRPGKATPPAVSIASTLAGLSASKPRSPRLDPPGPGASQISALSPLSDGIIKTPATARLAALRSPCFFHRRFDDAVNIDRVIEEITAEEEDGMTHSRLMQTATSVREISKQLQRRPIKNAVRTVMIVTKARDNGLVRLTRDLASWLLSTPRYGSDLGVTVYVDAKLRNSKRFDAAGLIASNPRFEEMLQYWEPDLCWASPERFDLVLTLGGDGTVLYTSCLFQRIVPPVLAFSLGSLGFLTNFEFADYKTSLDRIMGDAGMRVNLRMRFTCTVFRANLSGRKRRKGSSVNTAEMVEGEQFEVLNELVIDRGPSPYVSNLELYGDDELLTVVQADGCIFSTPTGSTAYSLSAGGPLTHPSIPGILLTPICPHTLSFRPMVLSDSLLLKVCVPRTSRSTAYASFDGKGRIELRRGDCVQVEAGRYPFPTVVGEHGTGGEWFESVRRALRWNTRGAMQKSFLSDTKPESKLGSMPQDPDALEADAEDEEQEENEEEEWDINPDPVEIHSSADSGLGASEVSSGRASPRNTQSTTALIAGDNKHGHPVGPDPLCKQECSSPAGESCPALHTRPAPMESYQAV